MMRNLPAYLVLLLVFLGCQNVSTTMPEFDHARNEGYVAFIVNEVEHQAPLPHPDPDPAKCACKGTGTITHGDGHTTPCPYHAEDDGKRQGRCECDTKKTYCNCKATHGECSCKKKQ